jgi:Protein of unknown function (DUF1573)
MKLCKTISVLSLLTLSTVLTAAAQQKQPPVPPNAGSAPSGPAPLLVIESMTHDFGEVKSGAPLRYAFKIRNEGKADLLINSVTPG